MSWVQVLSAVQFGFAFFRKSRFRGFRSLRSEKIAKWIGIFPKKSRDEKTGEISRNLPFSLVFSCGSILTTQHGRGRRIRTRDPRFWRPVLYQLSYTPVQRWYYSTYPEKKQGVSRKIRKTFSDFSPYGACADATGGNHQKWHLLCLHVAILYRNPHCISESYRSCTNSLFAILYTHNLRQHMNDAFPMLLLTQKRLLLTSKFTFFIKTLDIASHL